MVNGNRCAMILQDAILEKTNHNGKSPFKKKLQRNEIIQHIREREIPVNNNKRGDTVYWGVRRLPHNCRVCLERGSVK